MQTSTHLSLKSPGVYSQEIPPIPGNELVTGIPVFLGVVQINPLQDNPPVPKMLTLWTQFEQHFDNRLPHSYLAHAVRGFFENGGHFCFVVPFMSQNGPIASDELATLNVDLFFDTTLKGYPPENVQQYTKKIFNLTHPRIGTSSKRPPRCKLLWGTIGGKDSILLPDGFLESVTKTLTHFLEDGTPVRATLSCKFREWAEPDKKKKEENLIDDPIRIVRRGETLSSIAHEEYGDPRLWRIIANENRLNNPHQISPGLVLTIPPLPVLSHCKENSFMIGMDLLIPSEINARFYGVTVGVVTNIKDSEGLGRIKVKFPWLSSDDESPWARVLTPMAGNDRGFYFLPEVDDEVLVAFEHGDMAFPYILGSLWNGKDKPPEKNDDGKNNKRVIKSRSGHMIVLDDTENQEKIVIEDKTGKNKITIDCENNAMIIQVEKELTIEAKGKVSMKSQDGDISIECKNLEIKTEQACKIDAGSNCNIQAKSKAEFAAKSGLEITCAAGVKVNNGALEVM